MVDDKSLLELLELIRRSPVVGIGLTGIYVRVDKALWDKLDVIVKGE